MVASGVQIICFDLASSLRGLKLLQNCRVTMLYKILKSTICVKLSPKVKEECEIAEVFCYVNFFSFTF